MTKLINSELKLILDYKPTTQESKCKICHKPIEKHDKRVVLDNGDQYKHQTKSYHESCLTATIKKFFEKPQKLEI